jgi:predicted metal-dependent peptidase
MAEAEVDWQSLLHRFIQNIEPSDYSWAQPNRSYMMHGLYLPSLQERRMGKLVWAEDTSGSVGPGELALSRSEVISLVETMRPKSFTHMSCDAKVQTLTHFEEGDDLIFHSKGGGGTSFIPVFKEIEKFEDQPVCLIYLTDLQGDFPVKPPEYPVIWLCTKRGATAPFGEVVYLDMRGH